MHFCAFKQRDAIQDSTCEPYENGWYPNFILFGGSRPSNETITLFNYIYGQSVRYSTNLFLDNNVAQSHLFQEDYFHYIPGKPVMYRALAFD